MSHGLAPTRSHGARLLASVRVRAPSLEQADNAPVLTRCGNEQLVGESPETTMVRASVLQTLHFGCGGRPALDDVRVGLTGAGLETDAGPHYADKPQVALRCTLSGIPARFLSVTGRWGADGTSGQPHPAWDGHPGLGGRPSQ